MTDDSAFHPSPISRVSVIIPTANCRAPAERAVASVLSQRDPIGIEIVVVDDGSRDNTADHLESVFGTAVAMKRLQVVRLDRKGDRGKTLNEGVTRSRGSFLAFLDPYDYWKPGHIERIEPMLSRHDLILGTQDPPIESSDWIRTLLASHSALTSAAIIRRTLFEEVGGFPEGHVGLQDYEFWIRCLVTLTRSDRKDRFLLTQGTTVAIDPDKRRTATPIHVKTQQLRELMSLVHMTRAVPPRYWSTVARRIAETGKALFKKP